MWRLGTVRLIMTTKKLKFISLPEEEGWIEINDIVSIHFSLMLVVPVMQTMTLVPYYGQQACGNHPILALAIARANVRRLLTTR